MNEREWTFFSVSIYQITKARIRIDIIHEIVFVATHTHNNRFLTWSSRFDCFTHTQNSEFGAMKDEFEDEIYVENMLKWWNSKRRNPYTCCMLSNKMPIVLTFILSNEISFSSVLFICFRFDLCLCSCEFVFFSSSL